MQSELSKGIEALAAHGKELPKDTLPPETMLYYMFFGLYAKYHAGKLLKSEAQQHKKRIISVYKRFKDEYEQFLAICRIYQAKIRENYTEGGKDEGSFIKRH